MLHTGTIPASKSRGPISWTFLETGDVTDISAGSLTTTEEVGKRNPRLVSSRYDVAEEVPPAGMRGRVFLFLKTDHKGDLDTMKGKASLARVGEVYECRLFADGHTTCTCTAGQTEHARPGTGPCIHILSARSLVADGVFPDNAPVVPATRVGTGIVDRDGTDPPTAWWAEAAGGRLVADPLCC